MKRLYETVFTDLAQRIFTGEFPVGSRLPAERILSERYGVSRPTIREAMIALEVDGLVNVRMGLGVFVIAEAPKGGSAAPVDMGPFELLEARRAIEGEACAIAASRITDTELALLDELLTVMQSSDGAVSEEADERFHLTIARASENSGISAAIDMLFNARHRSPQYRLMSDKAHQAGVYPRVEEHRAILVALGDRNGPAARAAMRKHLNRVLESFMETTKVLEMDKIDKTLKAHKIRFVE
ncbi:FadR/GntR family transcriptional regulator [Sphingomonas sp. 4RDLI-65]|uniref:FadR/GntR family transcriptional regulator n=1 Tax=Sphingomonas sp. 4RDLI-65 TaxID=3111641 RepID=UPI003C13A7C1